MKRVATTVNGLVRSKRDAVICVTGLEREGKSTFSNQLGIMVDPRFDIERNIVFTQEQLEEKIFNARKGQVISIDEGMKIFYKREWYKRDRIRLNKIFAEVGRKNLVFLINIPYFEDVEKFFQNHRIRIWAHVLHRGVAMILTMNHNPAASAWDLRAIGKRFCPSPIDVIEHLQALPNYQYTATFQPMAREFEKKYEKYKNQQLKKEVEKPDGREHKTEARMGLRLARVAKAIHEEYNISYRKMSEFAGYDHKDQLSVLVTKHFSNNLSPST